MKWLRIFWFALRTSFCYLAAEEWYGKWLAVEDDSDNEPIYWDKYQKWLSSENKIRSAYRNRKVGR